MDSGLAALWPRPEMTTRSLATDDPDADPEPDDGEARDE
jgi:hypothetical protein